MGIEQRRRRSVREYIELFIDMVSDYEEVLLESPQYLIDQHANKIRNLLDETSNTL